MLLAILVELFCFLSFPSFTAYKNLISDSENLIALEKSPILETKNLSNDEDSRTDTILERLCNLLRQKKKKKNMGGGFFDNVIVKKWKIIC